MRKLLISVIIVTFLGVTAIHLSGCSAGLSDEQITQVTAMKAEVQSLESEIKSIKEQKASLERSVGELNAKLEQCAKDKEATKKNLEKLPK